MLLLASIGFIAVAWKALDAAEFAMPKDSGRILAQFTAAALVGHAGLRLLVPRAAPQPYAIVMLLTAIGLAFVTRLAPGVAQDQVNWVTLGVAGMLVSTWGARRYALLRSYKYTAAVFALVLLLVTGVAGTTINGARLWITVAGTTVQTTELIKLFLLVFLAGYLADESAVLAAPRLSFGGRAYSSIPYLAPLAVLWLVAMTAVALLKDLGTVMLMLSVGVAGLYISTGRARFVIGGAAMLLFAVLAGYLAFGHVRTRIDTWLDPYGQPAGAGYQTLQSTYAIQAGGVTGQGLGLGSPQTIPAAPTDYVYSAIAEELGLAGAIGLALLYLVLLFAGLRVALRVGDDYGRMLAATIVVLIAFQAGVIIAGNVRVIPTTGITLPFVSYGGSSLIVNFALIGLLLGISGQTEERR